MNPRHKILTVAAISLLGVTAMPAQQPARKVPAVYILKCVEASPAIWASPKALAQQVLLHRAGGYEHVELSLPSWLSRNKGFTGQGLLWTVQVDHGSDTYTKKRAEEVLDGLIRSCAHYKTKVANADDNSRVHSSRKLAIYQNKKKAFEALSKSSDRITELKLHTIDGVRGIVYITKAATDKPGLYKIRGRVVSADPTSSGNGVHLIIHATAAARIN